MTFRTERSRAAPLRELVNLLQGAGIKHVLNPDPYRGRFGNDGAAYADDVRDVISTVTSGTVAGFCAETFQGVGGTVPLADGYLPAVYKVGLLRQTPLSPGLCACLAQGWAPLCSLEKGTCRQPRSPVNSLAL